MGLFGGQDQQQRFYPRPPQAVFDALKQAARTDGYALKRADDLSLSVELTTPVSAFTWGEKLTANCIPAEGGTTVTVGATGKAMNTVMQSSRNAKVVNKLFDRVTEQLR